MQGNWFQNLRQALIDNKGLATPELNAQLQRRERKESPCGLVNHFTVGGDPEFALIAGQESSPEFPSSSSQQIPAQNLGLTTGGAFGADLSGRQIELRLWASRSTLEVVASARVTLQWFVSWLQERQGIINPILVCSPFFNNDGFGGHVHFGRRTRRLFDSEINALDRLEAHLENTGIFDARANFLRRNATNYGHSGDRRWQRYGYEYRTYPTWLASPAQAMLVLTFAKLAVFDPEYFKKLHVSASKSELLTAAMLYAARGDSDAALCVNILRDRPRTEWEAGVTFGSNWELKAQRMLKGVEWFPGMIRPSAMDIEETKNILLGIPVEERTVTPTWTPTSIPAGYKALTCTHGLKMGEYIHGLMVASQIKRLNVLFSSRTYGMQIGYKLEEKIIERHGTGWKEKCRRHLKFTAEERIDGLESDYAWNIHFGESFAGLNKLRVRQALKYLLPVYEIAEYLLAKKQNPERILIAEVKEREAHSV